jgi:hypothetical protein
MQKIAHFLAYILMHYQYCYSTVVADLKFVRGGEKGRGSGLEREKEKLWSARAGGSV